MKLCIHLLTFTLILLTSLTAFSDDICQEIETNNTCLQDDYTALRALYLSTDGDSWGGQSGWLTAAEFMANPTMPTGTDVGTWYGVTTDDNGCVTHLSLVYNRLDGSIPPEIGDLSNLIELDLSGNSLHDADIPSEIGNLSNLTSLALVHATFESNIPPEIGNLTQLTSLVLDHLSGNIPTEIGNLTNLTHLQLGFTQFEGNVPAEIGNLMQLTNLTLYGITGSIPPEFYNLTQLTDLNLQYDQFTGNISPALGSLTALTELKIRGAIGNIPPELGNLTNLKELHLTYNQLTGSIPPELGNLIHLDYFYLYHNQLTGNIPPELGNLTLLKSLYLHDNQLSGDIPPELGNLTLLGFLILNNNQLTGNIPPELGNLALLRYLRLSNNQLSGCYPDNLSNLCSQLNNESNSYIPNGNSFDATWQQFCDSNMGVCPTSGCTSRVADANLVAIGGEFGQFANEKFVKNFLSAESNYIKYRTEIHRILESKDARYTKVNEDFDKIKNIAQTLLFKSFVSKHPVNITTEHIKVMDDFLVSLNQVTNKGKLKDEITKARGYLHVMKNKEIKDALIAFDRAEWTPTQIDTSNEFEAQLVNTNGQEPYVNYHLTNSGTVNINLYNANGQQIRLMQGNNSEGHHQIPIHKNELSAGIYFIHIEYSSNNGIQIKKVLKLPVVH